MMGEPKGYDPLNFGFARPSLRVDSLKGVYCSNIIVTVNDSDDFKAVAPYEGSTA